MIFGCSHFVCFIIGKPSALSRDYSGERVIFSDDAIDSCDCAIIITRVSAFSRELKNQFVDERSGMCGIQEGKYI